MTKMMTIIMLAVLGIPAGLGESPIAGGTMNGCGRWRDKSGQTLKALQEASAGVPLTDGSES
jgi:hypothetical protein